MRRAPDEYLLFPLSSWCQLEGEGLAKAIKNMLKTRRTRQYVLKALKIKRIDIKKPKQLKHFEVHFSNKKNFRIIFI